MKDIEIACRGCSQPFVFNVGQQEFHAKMGFNSNPAWCKECKPAAAIDEDKSNRLKELPCYDFGSGKCTLEEVPAGSNTQIRKVLTTLPRPQKRSLKKQMTMKAFRSSAIPRPQSTTPHHREPEILLFAPYGGCRVILSISVRFSQVLRLDPLTVF